MTLDAPQRPPLWKWALWFAALTGLTQAALVAAARLLTDRLVLITSDVVWMAPLADAVVFAAAAGVLQLTTRHLRQSTTVRFALFTFALLFLIGPLLIVPRMHPFAATLLGIGTAAQAARLLARRIDRFDAIARVSLPGLIGSIVVLGLGLHLSRSLTERRVDAAPPPIGPAPPNVVLIVLDTVRAQSLSLYGYPRRTSPHLDKFAKSGVVFERAFSTSPWTLPSHGSLFTGRYPHELSADWLTPLDDRHATIGEMFERAGYSTAGFVGNLLYATRETGLNRGFARYQDYPLSAGTIVITSWLTRMLSEPMWTLLGKPDRVARKWAGQVNEEFIKWLGSRPAKPFFAFLNYFDAHAPYSPPPPFDSMFGDGGPQPELDGRRGWSPEEIQRSMAAYDGAVAYLDEQLGRLLDRLDEERWLETTLVIITSDHGEQFGEHGLFDHANSLYRQVLQVPLLISLPGRVPTGMRISDPVSLADLPATVADLTRLASMATDLRGESLSKYWLAPRTGDEDTQPLLAEVSKGINLPEWLPASKGPMKSLIADGVHYIRHSNGREELYDFERDLAEAQNLAERPDARVALERSRRTLDALLVGDPRTAVSSGGAIHTASPVGDVEAPGARTARVRP